MKKYILFIFFVTAFSLQSYSQYLKNFVPASPTAASLGKYGDIPVSYYTGLPNISIPLFSIPLNGFTFSCALNYSADGLRTLEESSNVGLNWSIGNTGVITRNVRTIDDFSANGYFRVHPSNRTLGSGRDLEPDIFNFSFNGKAGKFLIDYPDGGGSSYTIKFLSRTEDLRVEIIDGTNWKITDSQGNIYKFEKKENQTQQTTVSGGSSTATVSYVSAWYLTSIQTSNQDLVTFTYKAITPKIIRDYASSTYNSITSVNPQPPCAYQQGGGVYNFLLSSSGSSSNTHTETDEVLLDEISYRGGKVSFIYMGRLDLQTNGGYASGLQSISMRNINGLQVKYFSFSYSYFTAQGNYPDHLSKRLKLDKLVTDFSDNAHHFLYDETAPLPAKTALDGNSFYINPTLGLLKKIYFPTGGYTEFEYEEHISRIVEYMFLEFAGARIKRIINKEVNNSVLDVKRFDYTKEINGIKVSSGVDLSVSMYSFPGVTYGICNGIQYVIQYSTKYSNNVLPSDYGNPTGYDEVTVYHGENGENGKSTYFFRNQIDQYPSGIFPGSYGARDVGNGLLVAEEHYKKNSLGAYLLISKKEFNYEGLNLQAVSGAKIVNSTLKYYYVNTGTYRSIMQKEYLFNDNADAFQKVANYSYHGTYLQPKAIETITSNGDIQKLIKRTAYDMVLQGQTNPYQQMLDRNMVSQVVEDEKQINNIILSKTMTQYSSGWPSNANLIIPNILKTQSKTEPAEIRLQYLNYDDAGNPLVVLAEGKSISYKWGYNKQYLVGEFSNTGENEFFLEDFEGNGPISSNNTNSHTGKGSYSGSINLSNYFQASYHGRSYLLSYFYYENNAWHHQQIPYIGQTISGIIDNIVIYPSNGKALTFTYEPSIGLTSKIDETGNASYFEYDGMNRLKTIRDHNKHIVKSYDYNLVLYTYYSNQKSRAFTKNNCDPGSSAAPTLFVVPSGQFTSTISQEDADLQALVFLEANGQNYANANGICTQSAAYSVTYYVDSYFSSVNYSITKSFDDGKRALCKVRIRYDPLNGGGAITEVIEEIQTENGILVYNGYRQINAATTCEVELLEVIEN